MYSDAQVVRLLAEMLDGCNLAGEYAETTLRVAERAIRKAGMLPTLLDAACERASNARRVMPVTVAPPWNDPACVNGKWPPGGWPRKKFDKQRSR
jgi:hypothetical protein